MKERSIVGLPLYTLLLVRLFGDEVQFQETLTVVEHCLGILTHGGQTHLCVGKRSNVFISVSLSLTFSSN